MAASASGSPFRSLRFRLVLLVALGALPPLVLLIHAGLTVRARDREKAEREAFLTARGKGRRIEALVQGAQGLLAALAANQEIRKEDVEVRNALLAQLLKLKPDLLNVGILDEQARIIASALPAALPVEGGDSVLVQRCRESADGFAVGDVRSGRLVKTPTLRAGLAIPGLPGRTLFATFNPAGFLGPEEVSGLTSGFTVWIADRTGALLVHSPEPAGIHERSMSEHPAFRAAQAGGQGAVEGVGPDGIPRLFGYAALEDARGRRLGVVSSGIPLSTAYGASNRHFALNLGLFGAASLLSTVLAWAFAELLFAKRLRRLLAAAGRIAQGESGVRTGGDGKDELGRLDQAFDAMAAWLEVRQASLAESEERFQAFMDASPVVAYMKDEGDVVSWANRACREMFGGGVDLAGKRVNDIVSREQADAIRALDRPVFERGVSVEHEEELPGKDGKPRCWATWRFPLLDRRGRRLLGGLWIDVTRRRDAEDSLRKLNRDLECTVEERTKDLESFSYSVSHDLRAPLRHAGGFVELLEKHAGPLLDEKSKRYLKVIGDSTRRMGRLIDDLLAFSRTGRTEFKAEPVPLGPLVEKVRRDLEGETAGRSLRWEVGELPTVMGDRALLRQAFENLLGNAVKYTSKREAAVIEVGSSGRNGRGVAIYVRDNGVGFDMAYAEKLFGVFQRLHKPEEFEGTGIGLANVKRIVDRHGGTIRADARPGEGATFTMELPEADA